MLGWQLSAFVIGLLGAQVLFAILYARPRTHVATQPAVSYWLILLILTILAAAIASTIFIIERSLFEIFRIWHMVVLCLALAISQFAIALFYLRPRALIVGNRLLDHSWKILAITSILLILVSVTLLAFQEAIFG